MRASCLQDEGLTRTCLARREYRIARHAPARLGAYELTRTIGAGGMATVFEARHQARGRVAIKLLHPHLAHDGLAARRFAREAQAAAAIDHPNVVQVIELGEDAGLPFLVLELLEGRDLRDHLALRGRLELDEVMALILPVIDAVAAAHDAGIVHRDLKPANIFLGPAPKILDFGISKLPSSDDLTDTRTTLGTVSYMSPELVRAARSAGPASDQYAIGVLLYECTTGQRPFQGEVWYEIINAILCESPRPPSAHRADLCPAFDALVARAMDRDPARRFASVRELGDALRRAL
jgi:serine/threonine-protein kinase